VLVYFYSFIVSSFYANRSESNICETMYPAQAPSVSSRVSQGESLPPQQAQCPMCDTLIIKYKHYKKKFERERQANLQLQQTLAEYQQQQQHPHNHQQQPLFQHHQPLQHSPPNVKSVLGPEFHRLGNEVETLLARNVELEATVAEMAARNTDLKNCLLIAQSRKQNIQSVLLSNMRVYEKTLEESLLMDTSKEGIHYNNHSSANPNDVQLMEQLFAVQENIEKILIAEVTYLRELVTAQQYTIISPNKHPSGLLHPNNGSNANVHVDFSGSHRVSASAAELRRSLDQTSVKIAAFQVDESKEQQPQEDVQTDAVDAGVGGQHESTYYVHDNRMFHDDIAIHPPRPLTNPQDLSILDTIPGWDNPHEVARAYSHVYSRDDGSGFHRRATTRARTLASRRVNSPTAKTVPLAVRQQLQQRLATQHTHGRSKRSTTGAGASKKSFVHTNNLFMGSRTVSRAALAASNRVKKASASRKWASQALQDEVDKILGDISGVVV
jgi:hypothetical protein